MKNMGLHNMSGSAPGKSGVIPLFDGYDAFAARLMIADHAEETLDLQYYIWENDLTGTLMYQALIRAADRGVKIRILLDDHQTDKLDRMLSALKSHPAIRVRLFNPYRNRSWRMIGNLTEFSRLNRRMHNKSLTADNQVSIIGGRNIGDEYFHAGKDYTFIDLDVLTTGKVVKDVSADFEKYWSCDLSHPADSVLGREGIEGNFPVDDQPELQSYLETIKKSAFTCKPSEIPFEWTDVQLISDDPEKALADSASDQELLHEKLLNTLGTPKKQLLLAVPYFVPGVKGTEFLIRLRKQNVDIKILTNSFNATDVPVIHAGYIKHRKKLLEAGVQLFELKDSIVDFSVNSRGSSASLHAKTFCIDQSDIFIGSCNFDPRSSLLNTEMGVIIKSRSMANKAVHLFHHTIPARSYEVKLNENNQMQWLDYDNGSIACYDREPGMNLMNRTSVHILSKLPIEWML